MCVIAPQKCAGVHGRAQKLCCLIVMLSMQPRIESGTLSLRKRASGTVKSFPVIWGFKCGLPGLLVAAEPLKMRALVHKIGRLLLRMLCCAVAGGFSAHPFLKSTCTDFVDGGRSWSGLAVAGEPAALHNHLRSCLPNMHAAVWPINPAHKLTRSAAARFLSNHTHKHTVTLCVCKSNFMAHTATGERQYYRCRCYVVGSR